MAEKKHWWQEQPLTISAVQIDGDDENWLLDEYVSKYSFNTEQLYHLFAKDSMAYFSEAEHGEKLDAYLRRTRACGLREIAYHNTHCINNAISEAHPDWLQIDRNGNRMPAYSIYNLVCVNPNGAWHKAFLQDLRDLCHHDIDGVFLDGPVMRDNGCFCETCRRDFEARFGHSIDTATRYELQTMRVELVTRHIREAYETVKSINPEIALYLNNSALRSDDVTGNNSRKVYDYVDIVGAEGGFYAPYMGTGLWQVSAFSKHLEAIVGEPLKSEKPIVCFFSGNESGITYYLHTPAETVLTYAQCCANGSNVWYGVHFLPSECLCEESVLTAKRMNEFILGHRDVFAASQTCARVALMWSQCTANNYASSVGDSDFAAARKAGYSERGDHRAALLSQFDMLVRNHIQFDIVDEVSVENGMLERYEAVILPEVACLSDKSAECIRRYVENGGNILANFDVGMYNEDGSFAGQSKLSDVFGFADTPEIVRNPSAGMGYVFKTADHPLTDSLSFFRIPGMLLNAAWKMTDDVQVLAEASRPLPSNYAPIPAENRYPAVTTHRFGKGCAAYICGNFGESVLERNITDYSRILISFCSLSSRPVVQSADTGLYEVVLRRQENRFILHIVNLTGAMTRPIQKIVPLSDVAFTLNLSGFGMDGRDFGVKSLRDAQVRDVVQDGETLSFTLDKLDAYEILVIES